MTARTAAGVAASFLLAAAAATVVACAPRTAGTGSGSPKAPPPPPGAAWRPRAPVSRSAPLPADPDLKAGKDDFTGSDSCYECHVNRWKSLESSFHGSLLKKGSGSAGCEECHGPGIDHVGDGALSGTRHPLKVEREKGNAVCLRCHQAVLRAPVRGHPQWVEERKVGCAVCHTVHAAREKRVEAHGTGPFASEEELLAAGAEFTGPARCVSCHPDYHPAMKESGHRDLATEGKACGVCHGPGSLHAASGGLRNLILDPEDLDAAEADRSCNACHGTADRPLLRWTCAEHRAEGTACVACHSPNEPLGKTLRAEDPALCVRCHQDTAAQFRLPVRHRVLEGWMECNDCHDPHGNEAGFHRMELVREACFRCHPEKAGPFVFDHGAKTLEGCVACHLPHGSPNQRLLQTRDTRTLCLTCHPDLPDFHEQRPGSVYRECLRCHVEIHGSDTSRTFRR